MAKQMTRGSKLGWWTIATLWVVALLASSVISGFANIYAWKSAAGEGILFFGIPKQALNVIFGAVSELCGVVGLVLAVWCFRARNYIAFMAVIVLTIASVLFNGFSSYRAFSIVAQDKVEDRTVELNETLGQGNELERLKDELAGIPPQKPSATIRRQIEALPVDRITVRNGLLDELGWAESREAIEQRISEIQAERNSASISSVDADKEIVKADIWWWAIAAFLEYFKATAAWILVSANRGVGVGRIHQKELGKGIEKKDRPAPRKQPKAKPVREQIAEAQAEGKLEARKPTSSGAAPKANVRPIVPKPDLTAPSKDHDVIVDDHGNQKVVRIVR